MTLLDPHSRARTDLGASDAGATMTFFDIRSDPKLVLGSTTEGTTIDKMLTPVVHESGTMKK